MPRKISIAAIAGLALSLGWPYVRGLVPGFEHRGLANAQQDVRGAALSWIIVSVLALIVIFWERVPLLESIGLRKPRWLDWVSVPIAFVATFVAVAIVESLLPATGANFIAQAQIFALPLGVRVLMVISAGVCEEVCFRGYAIERLTALTGNVWIAASAALVLFIFGHWSSVGINASLLPVAIAGAALTLLYVWRRNLWPCIALHCLIDATTLLLGPSMGH